MEYSYFLNLYLVHYRVGSLENTKISVAFGSGVHYRVGSLENLLNIFQTTICVHYRVGSLEMTFHF